MLAPLAGIGNWFVRLQAKRYGAGLVVSEMVSSFGLEHGNERTVDEFLRIHPDEHPVSMQLFGHDADVMRRAAAIVAEAGADLIDLNMGCPVRKVCKTGAGAALLDDPDRAVAIARAAGEGSRAAGDREAAPRPAARRARRRRRWRGGSWTRRAWPASASTPATRRSSTRAARLRARARARGALRRAGDRLRRAASDERPVEAFEQSGAEAVMLARGSLGNPWRFERLLGRARASPSRRRWWTSCAG